jgi:hypothetical protein
MAKILLIISVLVFGCGILFSSVLLIYSKISKRISLKLFGFESIFACGITIAFSLFAFIFKQVSLGGFLLLSLSSIVSFSFLVGMFLSPQKKLKQGVDLSCREEWLNLSYLLTLSERIQRFVLSEQESEFVEGFTQKIRRMTSYYCYEIPTGVEICEFYRICNRVGVL